MYHTHTDPVNLLQNALAKMPCVLMHALSLWGDTLSLPHSVTFAESRMGAGCWGPAPKEAAPW